MVDKNRGKPKDADPDLVIHWHSLELHDLIVKLDAHTESLSTEEVARRLERYGPNELKEKPRPTFLELVVAQLNNFIVILLIVASIVSALLDARRTNVISLGITPETSQALIESFMIAVGLAIAAVPEGLAGRSDHQPGAGHARDGAPARFDPQAGLRGNAWFGHGHLLG
jgi:magnesium-transporting ATPase (P-type)